MNLFPGHFRKHVRGFTVTELMAVATLVTGIGTDAYLRGQKKAYETECKSNLREVGKMIKMYQGSNGEYPDAAFYPKKPRKSSESIINVMKNGGMSVPSEMWTCPAAPEKLKKKGLTFIYNDQFGGRQSLPKPAKAWLMIEVHCVSDKVPPPHPNGYNVLFADGHVITTKKLPRSITSKQEAALKRLWQRVTEGERLTSAFQTRH